MTILAVGASAIQSSSPWETELKAILSCLMETDARGISNFLVLCDSLNAVQTLSELIPVPMEYQENY